MNKKQHQEIIDKIKEERRELEGFYERTYLNLTEILDDVKAQNLDREDLCDLGFFCRKLELRCEELKREFGAKRDLISKIIALRVTREATQNDGKFTPFRGRYSSASANVTMTAACPKYHKRPKDFLELSRFLGIPDSLAKTGVLEFAYEPMGKIITEQIENAENIPDCLKLYPNYFCTYRANRNFKDEEGL